MNEKREILSISGKMPIMTRLKTGTIERKSYNAVKGSSGQKPKTAVKSKVYEGLAV